LAWFGFELLNNKQTAHIAGARPVEWVAFFSGHRSCSVQEKKQNRRARQGFSPRKTRSAHRAQMAQRLRDKRKKETRSRSRVVRIGPNDQKNGYEHAGERNPKRPEFLIAQGERKSWKHQQYSQPAECGGEPFKLHARNVLKAFPGANVFFALPDVEELFESLVVEMFFWK